MPSRRRLILAGIVTLLAGLVILFPARVAYRWLGPPDVAIGGIEGSIWSGSAAHASGRGVYLSNIKWSLQPLALVTGKLAYDISARPGSGFLDANIAVNLFGTMTISDLDGAVSLQTFAQIANISGLRGDASLRIERLVVVSGIPIDGEGKIEVANLLLPKIAPTTIGGYKANFVAQEDGIVASVEDTDGVVDLAGSLSIAADGSYQFLGLVAAKAATSERIKEDMRFLGSPNERGQYQVRLEGQL